MLYEGRISGLVVNDHGHSRDCHGRRWRIADSQVAQEVETVMQNCLQYRSGCMLAKFKE